MRRIHYRHRTPGGKMQDSRPPKSADKQRHSVRPVASTVASTRDDLRNQAKWFDFHDSVLMPARRRGGQEEVRRVLMEARNAGKIRMNDNQLEQEIRDVMAAPDCPDVSTVATADA